MNTYENEILPKICQKKLIVLEPFNNLYAFYLVSVFLIGTFLPKSNLVLELVAFTL